MSLLNKTTLSGTSSSLVATTTLANSYLTWNGSFKLPDITYHVLGEDIEVKSHFADTSSLIVVAISTLNILGKPFYDELKKNGFVFPHEIEEYLGIKFKILQRDSKINEILD